LIYKRKFPIVVRKPIFVPTFGVVSCGRLRAFVETVSYPFPEAMALVRHRLVCD
jgi:hypothetical protein